ncbi:MAG: DMT family transporter [Deltaproteobacteria bacterium]|nr:DMT family transporter [Deltaproteobacteria bacterium]
MTEQATTATTRDPLGLLLLFVGVVSVGAAAILVRLADAHPLTTSFVRLALGGLVLLAGVLLSGRSSPRGPELKRAVVAGVLLAVHFGLWIGSLSLTTVTASVVLVCLQPVFVAVLARVFLRETTSTSVALGIAIALAGALLIASDGAAGGTGSLSGNALAIGGAIAIAVYVLVLRTQRGDVLATSAVVTSTAALVLLPVCLAAGAPLWASGPRAAEQAGWLLVLALGPQVVGHTALNAALKRLPAAVVSGSILGEPVIASILAFLVLNEEPGPKTAAGAVVTLIGLVLLLRKPKT